MPHVLTGIGSESGGGSRTTRGSVSLQVLAEADTASFVGSNEGQDAGAGAGTPPGQG